MELGQELDQLVLVSQQDVQDRLRLVRVRHKHFEHVEGLELDVARLLLQHVHHELKVVGTGDILGHHRKVVSVKEEFSQEFKGLPPRHVVITVQQFLVLLEHLDENAFLN